MPKIPKTINLHKAGNNRLPKYVNHGSGKEIHGSRWRKISKIFRGEHPCCVQCLADGRGDVPSQVVDHIVPHRGNDLLFWDEANWQALCAECHNRKTGRGL